MPTVYGALGSPFVRKVLVALAEKGIKYDFEQLMPFNMSPENRKLSPLGKIPAFRDGDRTLADSSVIIAYLEKIKPEPALYPSEPYEYARALWFEEYGDGGLAPIVGGKIFFQRIVGPRFLNLKTDEAVVKKAIEEELPPMFDYLEGQLGSDDWLVGGPFHDRGRRHRNPVRQPAIRRRWPRREAMAEAHRLSRTCPLPPVVQGRDRSGEKGLRDTIGSNRKSETIR